MDQALQIAGTVDDPPNEDAGIVGQRLVENDVGPHNKTAGPPRELVSLASNLWREGEHFQGTMNACQERVGNRWRVLAGDICPNVQQIPVCLRGPKYLGWQLRVL